MRYSQTHLTLRYVNRSGYFGTAALLLLVSVMFLPWFLPTLVRDLRLTCLGQVAVATIQNKNLAQLVEPRVIAAQLLAHGGRHRPQHYLSYQFVVNGQVIANTEVVSESLWNEVQLGAPHEVIYLPSDPHTCRLGSPLWFTGSMPFVVVGMVTFVSSVALPIAGIRDIRAKVRLICTGTPAIGAIDEVVLATRKGRTYVEHLAYSYLVLQDGQSQRHEASLYWDIPYSPGDISVGDLILVLYDAENPTRHVMDAFGMRDADKEYLLSQVSS